MIDVSDCRVFDKRSRFFDTIMKANKAIVADEEDIINVDAVA